MGMAASQARLLSITARLTDNENSGQSISYAKQRLADQTQQITNEYNEALEATKLTVLTGFNGTEEVYSDLSYKILTNPTMAENVKQYVVTDTKGRILVTEDIANAYSKSGGNYNSFLAALNITTAAGNVTGEFYSQADITVQNSSDYTKDEINETAQKIHEAWDAYFATVGISLGDNEHDGLLEEFKWTTTFSTNNNGEYINKEGKVIDLTKYDSVEAALAAEGYSFVGSGYASYARFAKDKDGNIIYEQAKDKDGNLVYETDEDGNPVLDEDGNQIPVYDYSKPAYERDANGNIIYDPINYEGTTDESRELYDYAMALTEAFFRTEESLDTADKKAHNQYYDMGIVKSAADPENASILTYYKNIFDKMHSCGYFTYTDDPSKASSDPEHYTYAGLSLTSHTKKTTTTASPLEDNTIFVEYLKNGTLRLEYYSTADKEFVSTTLSEDTCIQEVEDDKAIAKAETKYNQDMLAIENQDKILDLELNKLDTEHSALQTEYDSVKNIVDKNVESSFKTFG